MREQLATHANFLSNAPLAASWLDCQTSNGFFSKSSVQAKVLFLPCPISNNKIMCVRACVRTYVRMYVCVLVVYQGSYHNGLSFGGDYGMSR